MSQATECTVLVRDRERVYQLKNPDEWTLMTLVATLSADPRSFDELARAWLRYQPDAPLEDLPWSDTAGQPVDGIWLIIDLACLQIITYDNAQLPENGEAFQRDEGKWNPDIPVIWINLPPHWQQVAASGPWQEALAPLPAPSEPIDARGILFGRALAEGIAHRTLDIARREVLPGRYHTWDHPDSRDEPTSSQRDMREQWHNLTVRVHADWLMTPRADLGDKPPRTYLHGAMHWVDRELHNRHLQYFNQQRVPRPLDRDTFAYRYGPFGRHEIVMYFELCRELIHAAWAKISAEPAIDVTTLTDFLHEAGKRWLSDPSFDGGSIPPADVIENERRRIPLISHGGHVVDDDCPLCRMSAEQSFGPAFIGFDGHQLELDDEFAFSLCETREQWEAQQEETRAFMERWEAKEKERARQKAGQDDSFSSVWSNSYVNEELTAEADPFSQSSIMTLAVRLAELITDLKRLGAEQTVIRTLNEIFDGYRAAVADPALRSTATTQLVDVLEQLVSAHPELTAKVADFQSQLDEKQWAASTNADQD